MFVLNEFILLWCKIIKDEKDKTMYLHHHVILVYSWNILRSIVFNKALTVKLKFELKIMLEIRRVYKFFNTITIILNICR